MVTDGAKQHLNAINGDQCLRFIQGQAVIRSEQAKRLNPEEVSRIYARHFIGFGHDFCIMLMGAGRQFPAVDVEFNRPDFLAGGGIVVWVGPDFLVRKVVLIKL